MTVGRRAANSMLNSTQQSSGPIRYSNFTKWSGTILLGGSLGLLIGALLTIPLGTFGLIGGVVLGMYLMYGYYNRSNKRFDEYVNQRVQHLEKVEGIIDNIKEQYVGNKITKREYEILMKDAQKLYDKI